jgi:hypothetical protein
VGPLPNGLFKCIPEQDASMGAMASVPMADGIRCFLLGGSRCARQRRLAGAKIAKLRAVIDVQQSSRTSRGIGVHAPAAGIVRAGQKRSGAPTASAPAIFGS